MTTEPLFFSRLGRYALRTMAVLVRHDERMTGKELADQSGVPPAYQSKVLRRLVDAEILEARKGHHGGFALAVQPQSVRLADVLAAVDALPTGGACVFEGRQWCSDNPCQLHNAWTELSEQIRSWAEGTTLADIASAA